MVIRQASSYGRYTGYAPVELDSRPRSKKFWVLIIVVIFSLISWAFLGTSHANSKQGGPLKSGWSGYCLDDYRDKATNGNQVDLWNCNDSQAQDWQISETQIKHVGNECLTVDANKIIQSSCDEGVNQVWIDDDGGLINPNTNLCLTAPKVGQDQQLELDKCGDKISTTQSWTPSVSYADMECSGDQASKVACYSVKEWIAWQSDPNGHLGLLNAYTGGASYEEWCADFVSYVYREAGYPFSNGNYSGWDENIASQIQNQGFTIHQAGSYIPKPGDVAFFDYPGGHVEIVVSGGPKPTFVYGNSEIIDPTTGNGEMATNTILSKGSFVQVQYYMTPNSST